jgi:hypothetical protein
MEPILFFLLLIVGFFLFRLIVNVVLPVMRTIRHVRNEFVHQAPPTPGATPKPSPSSPAGGPRSKPNWDKMGDYIDFEEVK